MAQNAAPELAWRMATWAKNDPDGNPASWHGTNGVNDHGGGEDWYHDLVAIEENGVEKGYISIASLADGVYLVKIELTNREYSLNKLFIQR